jgi:hypothetical protein
MVAVRVAGSARRRWKADLIQFGIAVCGRSMAGLAGMVLDGGVAVMPVCRGMWPTLPEGIRRAIMALVGG